jgi:hypothetical protein
MNLKFNLIVLISLLSISTSIIGQSISGKVFNDANNNGIQDGAEVGYPCVVVNAYAPGSVTPFATTQTIGVPSSNSGQYTLTGLTLV